MQRSLLFLWRSEHGTEFCLHVLQFLAHLARPVVLVVQSQEVATVQHVAVDVDLEVVGHHDLVKQRKDARFEPIGSYFGLDNLLERLILKIPLESRPKVDVLEDLVYKRSKQDK